MNSRAELIRDWQERLEADEAQFATAGPRMAWLFRARARIYRLLLSLYMEGSWRSDRDAQGEEIPPPPDAGPQQTELTTTAVLELPAGKPPKSLGDIRKRLKAVHAAVEPIPAGNADAIRTALRKNPDDTSSAHSAEPWGIVATCQSARERWRLRQFLDQLAIAYEVRGAHFYVPESERTWAIALVKNERHRFHARIPAHVLAKDLGNCAGHEVVANYSAPEDRAHLMRVLAANDIPFQCRGTYFFVREEDAEVAGLIIASERRLGKLNASQRAVDYDLDERRRRIVLGVCGIIALNGLLVILTGRLNELARYSERPQIVIVATLMAVPVAIVLIHLWLRILFPQPSAQRPN